MPMKLRGAPHAAEIRYVFRNLDEKIFSPGDLRLSEMIAKYWTNFAKNGDPNGENLPLWPQFTEREPIFMYLNSDPAPGPVPNIDKLELMEKYFRHRREASPPAGKN